MDHEKVNGSFEVVSLRCPRGNPRVFLQHAGRWNTGALWDVDGFFT